MIGHGVKSLKKTSDVSQFICSFISLLILYYYAGEAHCGICGDVILHEARDKCAQVNGCLSSPGQDQVRIHVTVGLNRLDLCVWCRLDSRFNQMNAHHTWIFCIRLMHGAVKYGGLLC